MSINEVRPTVSIVVPVRNGAATIGELLESLLKIDYDKNRLEIVVVDGNSTDGTRDIVAKYPVKLFSQEGEGLNGGRNTGIRNSSGEIVGDNSKGWHNFLSQYSDNNVFPTQRIFNKRQKLDKLSTWCLLSLIIFVAWLAIIGSLTFLTLATKLNIFLIVLLGIILMPLLASAAFYSYKALQSKRYERILIYPLLDYLRAFTFCISEICELLKPEKTKA